MAYPQGIITYTGVRQTLSASFTLGHGVSPSVATIRCLLSSSYLPETGELIFMYAGVQKRFRDCRVVSAAWQTGEQGSIWTLQIHDRRHRWKRGEISGAYNQRLPNGKVDPDTEKTPQELARLLLAALGDKRPDVAQLPNDQRPERNWEFASPAVELQRLCDELQCRVVLGLDDRIRLKRINEGLPLVAVPGVFIEGGVALTPDPLPNTIKVVMGPVRVESKLKLQAVGLDMDGQIKLIDNLSYKPAGGWAAEDPWTFPGVAGGDGGPVANLAEAVKTKNANALARRTVWRWYKIATQADGTKQVPKIAELVPNLEKEWEPWQLLPLSLDIVQTVKNNEGLDEPAKGWLEGAYWPHIAGSGSTDKGTMIEHGWTLDGARGIVQFEDLMFKVAAGGGEQAEAELYLTCSYELLTDHKDRKRSLVRKVHERRVNNRAPKEDVDVLRREDMTLTIQAIYDSNNKVIRTIDNSDDLRKKAEKVIDDRLRAYTLDAPQDFSYIGFVPIEPDGAIQQVTWTTDEGGAKTRASRFQEHNMAVPGHDDGVRKREQDDAVKQHAGRRQIGGRNMALLRFHRGMFSQ